MDETTINTSTWFEQPIYTVQELMRMEEELELSNNYIRYKSRNGLYFQRRNELPGKAWADAEFGGVVVRNAFRFAGERDLEVARANGREDCWSPIRASARVFDGPNIGIADTLSNMYEAVDRWNESEEADVLFETLKQALPANIDKIVAFGLGPIAFAEKFPEGSVAPYFRRSVEHAMLLTVAEALKEKKGMDQHDPLPIYVQDPAYTTICREVLEAAFELHIIGGFGARGFSLIDENTLVICHKANFPIREIIADVARPAAMCWKPDVKDEFLQQQPKIRAKEKDVDSASTERMLEEYQEITIPGARPKRPFYTRPMEDTEEPYRDSTWYVRKSTA